MIPCLIALVLPCLLSSYLLYTYNTITTMQVAPSFPTVTAPTPEPPSEFLKRKVALISGKSIPHDPHNVGRSDHLPGITGQDG
jgi:hypothetical protein